MKKEITFSYPAEAMQGATEIYLVGDFNNWNIEEAIKFEYALDGFFRAMTELEEGQTYHYRFLLDNGRWVNDHNAQSYVVIPELYVDNCVITVPFSVIEESGVGSKAKATSKKETKPAEESKPKSAAKPKKATDVDTKKATPTDTKKVSAESDSKKAIAEASPKKGSTQPAPKKATAKAEPAKAAGTTKPVSKEAKPTMDAKKAVASKEEKPAKEVKKTTSKSKK